MNTITEIAQNVTPEQPTQTADHDAARTFTGGTRKKVAIADDHGMVRDGLKLLLEGCGDFSVVAEAKDGAEAVLKVGACHPHVVVMDINMPVMNGIDATHEIREKYPSTQVLILSMYANSEYVFRALKAGAIAYVLKESAGRELIEALRAACHGKRFLSSKIVDVMVDSYLWTLNGRLQKSPVDSLTARERQIMQMIVEGRSSKEICDTLNLTVGSIYSYRYRIMQKIGVRDVAGLVRFACADMPPAPPTDDPIENLTNEDAPSPKLTTKH